MFTPGVAKYSSLSDNVPKEPRKIETRISNFEPQITELFEAINPGTEVLSRGEFD